MSFNFQEQLNWNKWVTPISLKKKPLHNWYVFPHSFTDDLVASLIHEWNLTAKDKILDPFAGAGTTILTAKQLNIPATGYDLSPFAVFTSKSKVANYNIVQLRNTWVKLLAKIDEEKWNGTTLNYPELVVKALPGKLLGAFESINNVILNYDCSELEKNFFRLAIFKIIPKYSRAIPTGGWLSWVKTRKTFSTLKQSYIGQVERMLSELDLNILPSTSKWKVKLADARKLPDTKKIYSAVISSPPYPNRHDYTRVFGVELMFGFLDWEGTRNLRYQSFESHPEAHPKRPVSRLYKKPDSLLKILGKIKHSDKYNRISTLLSGYFLDMYLSLKDIKRVCKVGSNIAYVVGNAQYYGIPIPVDELTAEVGEMAGLKCKEIRIIRYRGNSAQQMGEFGRRPSRESIVIFTA